MMQIPHFFYFWYFQNVFVFAAYFSNTEFSISERFQEAVSVLTDDQDPDVRAFFNPNQPPSNSEFYDSDGEPIGDVSVSLCKLTHI